MEVAIKSLRYMKGTSSRGIFFAYTDANGKGIKTLEILPLVSGNLVI